MRLVHYTVQRTPHKVVQEEWWKNKSVADNPINPKMNLKEDETETYMKKTTTVIQEGNGAFVVKEELEKRMLSTFKGCLCGETRLFRQFGQGRRIKMEDVVS